MAFWSRLRQSKLKFSLFSNEFKRCYTLYNGSNLADQHISSRSLLSSLINPNYVVQSSQLEFFHKVRSYAAPVLANQNKKEERPSGPRLNEQITAPTIRLVTDEDHFLISMHEALARAKSLKLDLVEVDRDAKPPVCKIFDYNKEKYIHRIKEKERAKSKTTIKKGPCKEVRFTAKIKQKDLEIKANMVKRLMESGHRVKCTAIAPTDEMDLQTLLSRFCALIEDIALVEGALRVEKHQAYVIVRHVKFGPSKKGFGKKVSKIIISSETGSKNQSSEDNGDKTEAGSETEFEDSEESLEEGVQTNETKWTVFSGDDDINTVFDIDYKKNVSTRSSKHKQPAIVNDPLPPPRQTMENRYARDPRSAKPFRIPTDTNSRVVRNTMETAPQVPNQGRHPQFSMNRSPQMRPDHQYQVPLYDTSKQNMNLLSKAYGNFNAQQVNTTPQEQSAPAETNRYSRNPPMNRGPNMIPNKNENQSEFHRR